MISTSLRWEPCDYDLIFTDLGIGVPEGATDDYHYVAGRIWPQARIGRQPVKSILPITMSVLVNMVVHV